MGKTKDTIVFGMKFWSRNKYQPLLDDSQNWLLNAEQMSLSTCFFISTIFYLLTVKNLYTTASLLLVTPRRLQKNLRDTPALCTTIYILTVQNAHKTPSLLHAATSWAHENYRLNRTTNKPSYDNSKQHEWSRSNKEHVMKSPNPRQRNHSHCRCIRVQIKRDKPPPQHYRATTVKLHRWSQ